MLTSDTIPLHNYIHNALQYQALRIRLDHSWLSHIDQLVSLFEILCNQGPLKNQADL